MEQLEKIVASMSSSDISLSESLDSYKKGVTLVADCQAALAEVEKVIAQVNPDSTVESYAGDAD